MKATILAAALAIVFTLSASAQQARSFRRGILEVNLGGSVPRGAGTSARKGGVSGGFTGGFRPLKWLQFDGGVDMLSSPYGISRTISTRAAAATSVTADS